MHKTLSLVKYFARVIFKEPIATFFNFFFPFIWNIVYLFGFGEGLNSDQNYLYFGFLTICTMSLLTITVATIPMQLISNRVNKVLKQFSVLKIKKHEYIFSLLIFQMSIFACYFAINLIIYLAIFNLKISIEFFYLFLAILIFFIPLFCIGVLLGSLWSSVPTTQGISQFVFFVILFSTGLFFPLDKMGDWFIYLQKIFPGGNILLLMQQIIFKIPLVTDIFPIIYVSVFTILIIPIAIYAFRFS